MKIETFFCDGCGRKLKGNSLTKAAANTLEAQKLGIPSNELFCPEQCMAFSSDYWKESGTVIAEIMKQAENAVSNYRKQFFQKQIKVVKEVEHGSSVTH